MKTLKVIAMVLLVVIVLGAGIYWMVSGMSNKGLEGFQTANTIATTISLLDTNKGFVNYGIKGSNYELYYNYVTYMNNLVYSYISNYTFNTKSIANSSISKPLESLNGLVLDIHYKLIPRTELVFMKIYDFFVASYPAKNDSFVLPGDIICKSINDIPEQVMIFSKTTQLIPQLSNSYVLTDVGLGREKIKLEKDNTPNLDVNLYISKQGLLRSMADNDDDLDGIIKTVWTYPQAFFVGQTTTPVVSNNKTKYEIKNGTSKLSSSDNKSVPAFQPFAVKNKVLYEFNLAAITQYNELVKNIQTNYNTASKKLLNTTEELTQKHSNLAAAQSELSAASAALNNAIKSMPSVEGFQTVGTTTTTTTAQVVSPIMAKINQLKELQTQRAAEFANAKATAEAQAKKASNNAAKAIDEAKAAAEAQAKKASNNAAKTVEDAKAAANAQVKAAEETSAKLQSEIASAETKLGLLSQQLKTAVSQFQDVAVLTTDKSLSDDLVSIETQINDLTEAKKSAEAKLTKLRELLQDAQFTTDPALLGSELSNARAALNNPPAQTECPPPPACPQQKTCPNISALDDTIRNLTNANASLGREIDTKAAIITDLEGKLGIANTTIKQLNDKIANFDKALTNEERASLTDAKNAAEIAKQEIEKTLKLTEAERDMAMKNRDELMAKYDACEAARRNMPVNAGTMMGGMPPSYVCKAMPPNSGPASLDRYAIPVPPDRYAIPVPPDRYAMPVPEMPTTGMYTANIPATNIPAFQTQVPKASVPDMPIPSLPTIQQGTEQLKQQVATSTTGIADKSLVAATAFTDIPKQAINQQIQNTKLNLYWIYRPENYDSHDRYAAPSTWWVTGYNA